MGITEEIIARIVFGMMLLENIASAQNLREDNMNQKRPKIKARTEADLLLETYLREIFPSGTISREMRFAPDRRWRFDYAVSRVPMEIPSLAIELEGGVWVGGRHTSGGGFQKDLDKYNSATALGWRVYRFSTGDVISGKCLIFLKAEAERL